MGVPGRGWRATMLGQVAGSEARPHWQRAAFRVALCLRFWLLPALDRNGSQKRHCAVGVRPSIRPVAAPGLATALASSRIPHAVQRPAAGEAAARQQRPRSDAVAAGSGRGRCGRSAGARIASPRGAAGRGRAAQWGQPHGQRWLELRPDASRHPTAAAAARPHGHRLAATHRQRSGSGSGSGGAARRWRDRLGQVS